MPTAMYPLYGTSVTGEPPVAASHREMEETLDSVPLLRSAMERLIAPEIAPDPGLSPSGPAPDNDFTPAAPTAPTPGMGRR